MQVSLSALWLPILLSAVFVFIVTNTVCMTLPFWHRKDYKKLPDEKSVLAALSATPSGQYLAPLLDWSKSTPEERDAMHKGPMALLMLRNPNAFSFGTALTSYFLYTVLISFLVAYITAVMLPSGTHYLRVFRVAGTAATLAYAFRGIPDSIWYGKPWPATLKDIVDGVIFGLLTAGTFGWLWPR
jgi:hypothetical protein